ncbi:Gfo/Idh/MocA family oxidoreductase [Leucobacter sp. USCH14]|uniref:Gfo/Idh/MocA family protein n=1 Tax=Leucobacter sp. USCH14 TaxID=3024838 RepID=UPI00309ECFF3
MEPLRIGVLGTARINEHTPIRPARDVGARIVAVAAREPERAQAYAEEHGIERALDDYAALVADPEVEVVYNPLPNALHAPWNLQAIAAGKHLLAEKPFASNAAEAAAVHRAASERPNLVVFNGFHYGYHPVFRRFKDVLRSGEIGDVQFVRAVMTVDVPDLSDIRWSWPLAGGALMDVGCYVIDALDHVAAELGGEAQLLAVKTGSRSGADPRVDSWAELTFALPGGVHGVAEVNLVGPREFSLTAIGSQGSLHQCNLSYVHTDDRLLVSTGSDARTEHLGRTSSFVHQMRAFRDAVRLGADYHTTTAAAVRNMRTIDAAYEMAGLPVRQTIERNE